MATSSSRPGLLRNLTRGVLAGLAGTVVMTAFQKLVEMPITGRADSYAPADFAAKLLPLRPGAHRDRVIYVTHFALGTMWGAAYGVAARAGLRGRRGVTAVFASVYTGDVLLNTALGLYQPSDWSRQDWTIDIVDKLVQAAAAAAIYDRSIDPITS